MISIAFEIYSQPLGMVGKDGISVIMCHSLNNEPLSNFLG